MPAGEAECLLHAARNRQASVAARNAVPLAENPDPPRPVVDFEGSGAHGAKGIHHPTGNGHLAPGKTAGCPRNQGNIFPLRAAYQNKCGRGDEEQSADLRTRFQLVFLPNYSGSTQGPLQGLCKRQTHPYLGSCSPGAGLRDVECGKAALGEGGMRGREARAPRRLAESRTPGERGWNRSSSAALTGPRKRPGSDRFRARHGMVAFAPSLRELT